MDEEVELDGNKYIRIGDEWYNASTFIKPPQVVTQRLDRYLAERSARKAKQHSKPGEQAETTFTHDELFPIIAEVIRQTFRRTQAFVTHDEIVSGLLEHPEGRALAVRAHERQGGGKPLEATAANMVAWFSQRITVKDSNYQEMFERKRVEGKWAYRPVEERPDSA